MTVLKSESLYISLRNEQEIEEERQFTEIFILRICAIWDDSTPMAGPAGVVTQTFATGPEIWLKTHAIPYGPATISFFRW